MKQIPWITTKTSHQYPFIDCAVFIQGCDVRVHNHFRGKTTPQWFVTSTTLEVDSCDLEAESLEDAKHKALHHLHNIARQRMLEAQTWAIGLMDAACAPAEKS